MDSSRQIGPYRILGTLGKGGNATVYRATADNKAEVALKVRAGKPTSEPYRRFKQEIETLESIGSFPGILPVLDAHIPEIPSKDDPAWFAMPVAEKIEVALEGADLELVVRSIATVAKTLERLRVEHGLGHRDIKPSNLYEQDGDWLIGDFGLVDRPAGENLTVSGKPIGSRHYTPWEMISDPAGADSHPADVYALGKTLWVLSTGQNYPPEGPQPAGVKSVSIGDYRPHPRSLALDRLIDRMTLRDPGVRPSKGEVDDELNAWLDSPPESLIPDVSALQAQIQSKLATEISTSELHDRYRTAHVEAWKRFEGRFDATINEMLRQVHPRPDLNQVDDTLTRNTMRTAHAFEKDYLKQLYRCSSISTGDPAIRFALRIGRGMELFEDGEMTIHAFVDVGYPATSGSDFYWTMEEQSAPAESLAVDQIIEQVVGEIVQRTEQALAVFAEKAPTS